MNRLNSDDHGRETGDNTPAIMMKKTRPNSFIVTDAMHDDNSMIFLSKKAAERLCVFRGDTVLVRGRLRRDTVLIVVTGDDVDDTYAAIHRVARRNLRVFLGDLISIYPCSDINYAKRVAVLPYADTIGDFSGSLFDVFLAPYFREAYRPLRQGDVFTIRASQQEIEFKVIEIDPPEYGVVAGETVIHCEGNPIQREEQTAGDIGYADVGGYQKELAQIREMVELPLRHPSLFRVAGVDPPRGLILHGPPGVGKSRIARAVSNETGSFIFVVDGIELLASGEFRRLMDLAFEEAVKNSPAVIILENVDLVAPNRDRTSGNDEQLIRSSVVLSSIDRLKVLSNVVVIGTTTNLENVDPALRRFGRLGYEINLDVPDTEARLQILRIHTKNMKLAEDVDLQELAVRTEGYVGSDLTALCFIASMQQIREKLPQIDIEDDGIYADVLDSLVVTMQNFTSALRFIVERNT